MIDLNALTLSELFAELTSGHTLAALIKASFDEDLDAACDVTTASIVEPGRTAKAMVAARQPGVVAGLALGNRVLIDRGAATCRPLVVDGELITAGQVLVEIDGDLAAILTIERTMLNFIGHLSGIATMTRHFVDAVAGTKTLICDTRKTTPGLRNLEKFAVRCGGGTLHRMGLYDAALYKDNHLAGIPHDRLARVLTEAITRLRRQHDVRFVEVEVDDLDQLQRVLGVEAGLVNIVLLDNMELEALRSAVAMRDRLAPRILLEASGGVRLDNVRAVAETGVDRISIGSITHSAPWLDVGLDIQPS